MRPSKLHALPRNTKQAETNTAHQTEKRETPQATELWDEKETAAFLKIKSHTLACWRSNRTHGPRWLKLGLKLVRYRRSDVLLWMAEQVEVPQQTQRGCA